MQTVIRSDLIEKSPSTRMRDVLDYHSDVAQAGETAARNRVKKLVLNHFVPPPPPGKEAEWAADAGAISAWCWWQMVAGGKLLAVRAHVRGSRQSTRHR